MATAVIDRTSPLASSASNMSQHPQHPDAIEEIEREEDRRVEEGFAADSDVFIHSFTHQDHHNPYPSKFLATNEEAYLQGE